MERAAWDRLLAPDADGVAVGAHGLDQLFAYATALAARPWPQLTASRDIPDILRVLVAPSLAMYRAWRGDAPPQQVIDLGSGNGFPGVAAAALWPTAHVHLVERRQRKAEALVELGEPVFGERVHVHACDVRELPARAPHLVGAADLITVRAVGPLADTTRWVARYAAPGARIVHWKSKGISPEELDAAAKLLHELAWPPYEVIAYGEDRQLFVCTCPSA